MRKIILSLAALVPALAVAPLAHAEPDPGWYASAGVGAIFSQDPKIHAITDAHGKTEDVNMAYLGSVGYKFAKGLRLEAEYMHSQHNLIRYAGAKGFGHKINDTIFLNALYDFKDISSFTRNLPVSPYIGAGIGPNLMNIKNYGSSTAQLDGRAIVAAYQAIAGFSVDVAPQVSLGLDYRYINSWFPKVDYSLGGEGRTSNGSHNAILSVRYMFEPQGQPKPEPAVYQPKTVQAPTMAPYQAERPAVAPVAQNFTVFFDFDKSVLTPEAKKIIASAVEQYKANGYARINVVGHTDTVGTAGYNQKLSERRAMAVQAELKRLGVGDQNIEARGVGENDLLVPTSEGVREAQNRRAEIILAK